MTQAEPDYATSSLEPASAGTMLLEASVTVVMMIIMDSCLDKDVHRVIVQSLLIARSAWMKRACVFVSLVLVGVNVIGVCLDSGTTLQMDVNVCLKSC